MAFLTTGGSTVTSANIVDGEIVNADVSPSAAIALSKLAGLVGNPASLISFETTTGTTHSLTTDGSQRVIVFASGSLATASSAPETVSLNYNAVAKHTKTSDVGSAWSGQIVPFELHYTEIPGAATQNITVTSSAGSVQDCIIIVCKLKIA